MKFRDLNYFLYLKVQYNIQSWWSKESKKTPVEEELVDAVSNLKVSDSESHRVEAEPDFSQSSTRDSHTSHVLDTDLHDKSTLSSYGSKPSKSFSKRIFSPEFFRRITRSSSKATSSVVSGSSATAATASEAAAGDSLYLQVKILPHL